MPLKRNRRDNTPSSNVNVFGKMLGCMMYDEVWTGVRTAIQSAEILRAVLAELFH